MVHPGQYCSSRPPRHGAPGRAGALVYAGIGFAHGQHTLGTPTEREISAIITLLAGITPH